jgi:hypothetical protein
MSTVGNLGESPSSLDGSAAGGLYDLDRGLVLPGLWTGLARFRGSSMALTRWLTRSVAPRAARLAAWRWRAPLSILRDNPDPFLLCLAREPLREGLPLLIAEWVEFLRLAPASPWRLLLRTCPASADQGAFEFIAPYWEQVRALKRQFNVKRASVYLWVRDVDDAEDEHWLDASRALVVVARGQSFADPLALALARGKPVIAPRAAGDDALPMDYPFAFATRPAVVRFLGEPRRAETASKAWPMPEPLALARAIRAATADPAALEAAGPRAARHWATRGAKVPAAVAPV